MVYVTIRSFKSNIPEIYWITLNYTIGLKPARAKIGVQQGKGTHSYPPCTKSVHHAQRVYTM